MITVWGVGESVVPLPAPSAASGIARWNDVGTAKLRWPLTDVTLRLMPRHAQPLRHLVVHDGARHVHSGPVSAATVDVAGEAAFVEVESVCDNHWLRSRVTYPDPSRAATAQTTRTHDVHGPAAASTVLLSLASAHAGPAARAERRVGFTLAPDPVIGPLLTSSDRWRNLLGAMRRYATWANLGFALRRSRGGALTLRVWAPRDYRSEVVWTTRRGNVRAVKQTQGLPEATSIIGAGQGEGTARVVVEVADAAAAGVFGRIEQFTDQRSEPDQAKILTGLQSDLVEAAARQSIEVTPETASRWRYGSDWDLGDWVTGGTPLSVEALQVMEVEWSALPDGSVQYRPLLGAPGTTNTPDDIIRGRATLAKIEQLEEAV